MIVVVVVVIRFRFSFFVVRLIGTGFRNGRKEPFTIRN